MLRCAVPGFDPLCRWFALPAQKAQRANGPTGRSSPPRTPNGPTGQRANGPKVASIPLIKFKLGQPFLLIIAEHVTAESARKSAAGRLPLFSLRKQRSHCFHNSESLRNDPSSETGFRNRKLRFHMRKCCAEEKHNQIVSKEEQDVQTCEPRRSRSESARNPLRIRGGMVPLCHPSVPLCHPAVPLSHLVVPLCHLVVPLCHLVVPLCHLVGPFVSSGLLHLCFVFISYYLPRPFVSSGRSLCVIWAGPRRRGPFVSSERPFVSTLNASVLTFTAFRVDIERFGLTLMPFRINDLRCESTAVTFCD